LLERRLDPVGDERKRRAAIHRQLLARMVGKHEDRSVEGRVLAPPAGPRRIPRPVAAAEHVAAHDVGANASRDFVDDLGIGAALATLQSLLRAPAGGGESPLVQAHPTFSDRVLDALVTTGDKTVERYRHVTGNRAHAQSAALYAAPAATAGGRWPNRLRAQSTIVSSIGRGDQPTRRLAFSSEKVVFCPRSPTTERSSGS